MGLELVDRAFDNVALLVGFGVEPGWPPAGAASPQPVLLLVGGFGDGGLDPAFAQVGADRAAGVGLMGRQGRSDIQVGQRDAFPAPAPKALDEDRRPPRTTVTYARPIRGSGPTTPESSPVANETRDKTGASRTPTPGKEAAVTRMEQNLSRPSATGKERKPVARKKAGESLHHATPPPTDHGRGSSRCQDHL